MNVYGVSSKASVIKRIHSLLQIQYHFSRVRGCGPPPPPLHSAHGLLEPQADCGPRTGKPDNCSFNGLSLRDYPPLPKSNGFYILVRGVNGDNNDDFPLQVDDWGFASQEVGGCQLQDNVTECGYVFMTQELVVGLVILAVII